VLITGQSFGAGSVAAHIFSPLSKGLFRAAAMWSACNFSSAGPDLATSEKTGLELQKRLGVPNLLKMRDVPADRILAQQAESQVGANVQGVRTPPLIDGYFTVGEKSAVLASHAGSDVPILVGSNGDDLDASQSPLTRAHTVAEYEATARQMYGAGAPAFLRLYPVKSDADVSNVAHTAARGNGMLKASRSCAQEQSAHNKSPAYITLFTHKHPYAPGVTLADQDPTTIGAYHTADVPYWFGTFDAFNLFRPTRAWRDYDRQLSDSMLESLIATATTGSPDSRTLKWPAWASRDEKVLVLGDEIRVEKLRADRLDWLAAHPPASLSAVPPRAGARD
jgi:para-nitrobenzyl esterase